MSVQDRIKEYASAADHWCATIANNEAGPDGKYYSMPSWRGYGNLIAADLLGFGGFAIGAEGAMIAFRPSAQLALSGAIVSALVGIIAGIVPALQVATLSIVTALRHE